jgi:ribosomal protein S18 acetylase RimI-like enzyme
VTAAIVPAVPERSVLNSVTYADGAALARSLDRLAHEYERAGVEAWTVWVHPGDRQVAAALEDRGHVLDATPAAMWRPLEGARRPADDALEDWTRGVEPATVAAVNDRAYPFAGDPWTRGFRALPAGAVRCYAARLGARPASVLMTYDDDGDCVVWGVATLPGARGRGLAGTLLEHPLADARERGCDISTLEATKLGEPLYRRLGYRSAGAIEMWERRG